MPLPPGVGGSGTGRWLRGGFLQQVGIPVAEHLQTLADLPAHGGGAELVLDIARGLRAQAPCQVGLAGQLAQAPGGVLHVGFGPKGPAG